MSNRFTEFVPLYVEGFQIYQVPGGVLKALQNETSEMLQNNFLTSTHYNEKLAGNIEKEFILKKSAEHLNYYISSVAPLYWKNTHLPSNTKQKHFIKKNNTDYDVWVNFQKKGEINPVHNHGGDLSFVIYIQLPYLYEEENNLPSYKNSNIQVAGTFNFIYPCSAVRGGIASFMVKTDKSFEGKMIVFDSALSHIVYPFFTSDDYRISVAGNIEIEK
jgi:hypothetical protein